MLLAVFSLDGKQFLPVTYQNDEVAHADVSAFLAALDAQVQQLIAQQTSA